MSTREKLHKGNGQQTLNFNNMTKVALYHEIQPEKKEMVLEQGIERSAEGEKTDGEKKKIDEFLDTHLPDWAKAEGLSRQNVTYAYLANWDKIVDITDGETKPLKDFVASRDQILLKVTVEQEKCFVSDLDLYDTLQRAMELDEQDSTREHLADRYWERIIPLTKYEPGMIKRPEVMINTDIAPSSIEVVELSET